ncbi:OLC1v1022240C1 [Oldenlandia corymbosa var. corymbosa]|uniref:OLC1v1022240C1 n=1 Tax=Oldenlandia corymbosa var. corymbosa TaxID=529605 RepID=A0AAV1BZ35_OLDCO|nr:OLC1v1022240C1 [Oldenlandia corymbosa var. corymbosa]
MWNNLPEDLLTEVLLRFPANSLWELRRVSKSWQSLIDSDDFIKSHLIRSSPPVKLLFDGKSASLEQGTQACCYATAEFDLPSKIESTLEKIDIPFHRVLFAKNKGKEITELRFQGSYNGLICMSYQVELKLEALLWNPCINQYFILPNSPVSLSHYYDPEEVRMDYRHHIHICYGFGYDETRDDYKVVRIVQFRRNKVMNDYDNSTRSLVQKEAKIYSLKSNSWKSVSPDDLFPHPVMFEHYEITTLANYALHWVVRSDDGRNAIAALDLRSDKYHLVPWPQSDDDDDFNLKRTCWALGVVDGCFSFTCAPKSILRSGFDLWIMKDYGVRDSWTKLKFDVEYINLWPLFVGGYTYGESRTAGRKFFFGTETEFVWCSVSVEEGSLNNPIVVYTNYCGMRSVHGAYIHTDTLVRPRPSYCGDIKKRKRKLCDISH